MIDVTGWNEGVLFGTVLGHQLKGIMFHNDLMNLNAFCGLHGYQKLHKHQVFAETEDLCKVQSYYITYCCKIPVADKQTQASVIPNAAYSAKKSDVTDEYRKKFVKDSFAKWQAWEEETIELYLAAIDYSCKKQCKELILWNKMLEETMHEYKYIIEHVEKLNIVGYDMKEILQIQEDIKYDLMDTKWTQLHY